jgi:hypothetical protein
MGKRMTSTSQSAAIQVYVSTMLGMSDSNDSKYGKVWMMRQLPVSRSLVYTNQCMTDIARGASLREKDSPAYHIRPRMTHAPATSTLSTTIEPNCTHQGLELLILHVQISALNNHQLRTLHNIFDCLVIWHV